MCGVLFFCFILFYSAIKINRWIFRESLDFSYRVIQTFLAFFFSCTVYSFKTWKRYVWYTSKIGSAQSNKKEKILNLNLKITNIQIHFWRHTLVSYSRIQSILCAPIFPLTKHSYSIFTAIKKERKLFDV